MPTRHSLWLLLFASSALFAQQSGLVDPGIIYQRAEQRQQQINRNAARQDFSTLDFSAPASEDQVAAPGDRHACTSYQHIVLDAPSPSFLHYLEQSVRHTPLRLTGKQTYHKAGECIRAGEVIDIVKATQNRLIEDGWITTRVVLQTEGSHKERLKLTILPGKIAQVRENKTNVQRTPGVFNYLQNKTINLRDLEQSLDNVHRLGSLDAQVDIAPSDREGYSDLVVNWQKTGRPYQFSFLVDDSGSKSLGKYLGTASIYIDNPLNFSDTFYASYTRTLRPGTRLTDQQGKKHKTLTDNYYLNYSIPWRSWQLGLNASRYHYDQIIPGYARVYHYKGNTQKFEAELSNTIYRDQSKKTTLSAGLWWRKNQNFINRAELDVQKRQTAGWRLGVKQTVLLPKAVFSGALNLKKGTRMLGANPVPEEGFDEGNAKSAIWTLDAGWNVLLDSNQRWNWQNDLHAQYAHERLISLDLLSIGGRNSVRGFSENNSISGDSGWYWRNTLNWSYQPNHQLYLGADMGQVWGKNTEYLRDKFIAGAVIGSKGNMNYHGNWQYDVFVGTPIVKSGDWKKTDRFVIGFSAGYTW